MSARSFPSHYADRFTLVLGLGGGSDFDWVLDGEGRIVGDPILSDPFRRNHSNISPSEAYFVSDTPVASR